LAVLFMRSGHSVFSQYQQIFENRAIMAPHHAEVEIAQNNFDNAALDFIDHMTQEEFDTFAHALGLVRTMNPRDFVDARDEEWLDNVLTSEQMNFRRDIGRMRGYENLPNLIDGVRVSAPSAARTQLLGQLENIVDNATIGESGMSIEEFSGERLRTLQNFQNSLPEIENHTSAWTMIWNKAISLMAAVGFKKSLNISFKSNALKKEELEEERKREDAILVEHLTEYELSKREKLDELEKKYDGSN